MKENQKIIELMVAEGYTSVEGDSVIVFDSKDFIISFFYNVDNQFYPISLKNNLGSTQERIIKREQVRTWFKELIS